MFDCLNGNHILWKADQRQWLQPLWRKKVATLFIFGFARFGLLFRMLTFFFGHCLACHCLALPLVCTCIWSGKLNVLVSDVSDFTRLLILRSVTYSIYQATWNKKCWQQKCDEVVSFNADSLFDGGSKVFHAFTISA